MRVRYSRWQWAQNKTPLRTQSKSARSSRVVWLFSMREKAAAASACGLGCEETLITVLIYYSDPLMEHRSSIDNSLARPLAFLLFDIINMHMHARIPTCNIAIILRYYATLFSFRNTERIITVWSDVPSFLLLQLWVDIIQFEFLFICISNYGLRSQPSGCQNFPNTHLVTRGWLIRELIGWHTN